MRRVLQYTLYFLLGAALAAPYLLYRTTQETFDQIWVRENRAYPTKKEQFKFVFLNGLKRLFVIGFKEDSYPVQQLNKQISRVYLAAVTVIPPDDFERIVWFHDAEFIPVVKSAKFKSDKHAISGYQNKVAQIFKNFNNYKMQSEIVKDVTSFASVRDFTRYFFDYADAMPAQFLAENKPLVLDVLYKNAQRLDPEKVLSYKLTSSNRIVYFYLTDAYYLLWSNIFSEKKCNAGYAKYWVSVSDKVRAVLIADPDAAKNFIPDENTQANFQKFYSDFARNDSNIRNSIIQLC